MVGLRGVLFLTCLAVAVASALPFNKSGSRIIGGTDATINQYPFAAAVLFQSGSYYTQSCGGTIINQRSILSAASCFPLNLMAFYRIRVGSSYANSGGSVHQITRIVNHASFNSPTYLDNDISVIRTTTTIEYSILVLPATLPSVTYTIADNQIIVAIGWGHTSNNAAQGSEQLQRVELRSVNQATCRARYTVPTITANMLCTGYPDVGGRDTCYQDTGSPQIHNNFVVGITSAINRPCGDSYQPGIATRVSRYISFINANAS